MTTGAYKQIGAKLVARGYAAIPVMPGTKRPGYKRGGEWIGLSNWRAEFSKRLPTQFEIDIWSASEAGVCVVCGYGPHFLIAVDIDTDRADVAMAILSALPPTSLVKVGAKGQTLFFRCKGIVLEPATSFNLDKTDENPSGVRVCDVIGPGRQTVLPPTIHPDTGKPYEWTGGAELESADPESVPFVEPDVCARIAAALEPFGYAPEPKPLPIAGGSLEASDAWRELNDIAMSDLSAWVPKLGLYRCKRTREGYEAVATWRRSNTGRADNKRKLNLKIHRLGIKDFGEDRTYTPIDLVCASQGVDEATAFKFFADLAGWEGLTNPITIGAKKKPREEPAPAEPLPERLRDPDPFMGLTKCPGLVGDIVDWITDTSRRPNRVLALGAAVTIIGTLMGRRAATPTLASTHLYFITLAPSGAGKDKAVNAIGRIMESVGAGHHVGPSGFMSQSALSNHIVQKPLSLSAIDEFGAFLKKINHRRGSSHEQGIKKILRTVWGKNFEPFVTDQSASKAAVIVHSPCFSIYGVSTPNEFYSGLEGSDLDDGFLNRFLVVSTDFRSDPVEPKDNSFEVPGRLITPLEQIFAWGMSDLALARLNEHSFNPPPFKVEWHGGAGGPVSSHFQKFEKHIQSLIDDDPDAGKFMARTAEMAGILATIRAVGRWGVETEVAQDDLDWGIELADEAGQRLRREGSLYIAENERQNWSNRILRAIISRGQSGATPRIIQQHLRGALKSAEIGDIIKTLLEGGFIEKTTDGYRATEG